MTGVRSPSRTTSSVAPSGSCLRAHPDSNVTARSMWPVSRHFGSNIGDLFGILMYSTSVGTIDVVNSSEAHWTVASETGMRALYRGSFMRN